MRLYFKSNDILENITTMFTHLTNRAIIKINDIDYDSINGKIIFPISRYKIIGYKKGVLGLFKSPIYSKKKINSVVTVNSIKDYEVKNSLGKNLSQIMVLFGFQIKDERIYFSSAEESKGNTLFEINIFVDKYDIDLRDM